MNSINSINSHSNSHLKDKLAPTALIIGCGYVGKILASKLVDLGITVFASTRSQDRLEELSRLGVRPLIIDITQPLTFAALNSVFESGNHVDLYSLTTPGRPGTEPGPYATAVEGVQALLNYLEQQTAGKEASIRKAVMTSSTGVYPFTDGRKISADTSINEADLSENPRSQLLYQSEQTFLSPAWPSHVIRLAGIYGPGRVIGKRGIRDGAPMAGDPNAILNLIYRDDAADLLIHAMASSQTAAIELGSDAYPAPRIEYYKEVARFMAAPNTLMGSSTENELPTRIKQRATSKRCDHKPTSERTGWSPLYPSFHEGLKQIFEVELESTQ